MYEEIMMNNDNLESNLLASILLKMLVQVELEICVEVSYDWRATDIYINSVKLIIQ